MRALALVLVAGLLTASCGGPDPASPRSYTAHCANVLVENSQRSATFKGAQLSPVDPEIVSVGPPAIVRCAVTLATGRTVAIEIEAVCMNGLQPSCSRPHSS